MLSRWSNQRQNFSKNLAFFKTDGVRWHEESAEGLLRTRHDVWDLCTPGPNQEWKVRNIGQVNAPYRVWSETIRGKEPLLDTGMDSSTILKWELGTERWEAADWVHWRQVGSSSGLSLARRPAFGFSGLRKVPRQTSLLATVTRTFCSRVTNMTAA